MAQKSAADRIREYKQLLDEGMITQEEFELKKKKILEEDDVEMREERQGENKDDSVFSGHYFQDRAGESGGSGSISPKATAVLAYLTWIGFIIAFFAGDRERAKFHLNQGLVCNLFWLLTGIPLIGKIWGIVMLVITVMGIINASNGENKEVPLIGGIHLL